MALEDYFGYDAPADRQIGGEWHTWVSNPGGRGGRMVPYSSLSPVEQQKLALGREYGANIYTTGEKESLTKDQAREIFQSYPDALRDALAAVPNNPPSGGYVGQPPAAQPPVAPPPAAAPPTPPPNYAGGVTDLGQINDRVKRNQMEQGIRNALVTNNPNDFMDWQAALLAQGSDQNFGQAAGGPAGSFGGGALWNQVAQPNPAPINAPATVRGFGSGIDPNFGDTPFDLNLPPPSGGYMGGLTDLSQIQDADKRAQAEQAIRQRLGLGLPNTNPGHGFGNYDGTNPAGSINLGGGQGPLR